MRRFFGFTVVFILSSVLYAESVTCENDNGSCVFNEDGSYECLCSEDSWGEGTAVAGSSDSSGEVTMPTDEECLEMVDEMCALPEGAVQCENVAGECYVMEDGDYWCDCYDGSSSGGGSTEPGEEPSVDPDETDSGNDDSEYASPGVDSETETDDSDSEEAPPSVDGETENETEPTPAEECESNADCRLGYICYNGYCYDAEECETSLDCKEGFICVYGYCIGTDGEEPVEEDPEKEVPECKTLLEETCGTEAPDLNKICSEEALEFCADIFNLLSKKCDGEEIPSDIVEEVKEGIWNDLAQEIVGCCNEYEYAKDEMKTLSDCLEEGECEDCLEVYEEAVGEYEDTGDSGSASEDTADSGDSGSESDGTNEEGEQESEAPKDSESDSSDGCSLTLV